MGSSYKVDIGALLAGGRARLLVDQQVPLEPFEGVNFPQPAHVQLEVRASGDMLELTGAIDTRIHGECDRCLAEIDRPMHVDIDERFAIGADAQADPFGEGNVVAGDRLDVQDLATQLVCSAVPIGFLCAEACQGICAHCGENKNTGACTCEPEGATEN
jgi:uncharacterized protein